MKTLIICAVTFSLGMALGTPACAGPPIIVDSQTGKYLGNLSTNRFDPNSTSNPMGRYGSRFSPDSINNTMGRYGSRHSPNSVNNPYASSPPAIISAPRHYEGFEGLDY